MKRQAEPCAGTLWEAVPRRTLRRARSVLMLDAAILIGIRLAVENSRARLNPICWKLSNAA